MSIHSSFGVRNASLAATISILGCLIGSSAAQAQGATNATIQVQCTGNSSSQVAMRWAHPDYSSASSFMPLFTAPCSKGMATKQLQVTDPNSEFEIQTEGGIQTGYTVTVFVAGKNGTNNNSITITHKRQEDPTVRGNGVGIRRSSGPNKYGEQNFRISIPPTKTAVMTLHATVSGDRSSARTALRWGHPDFHENEYLSTWTVKPGAMQSKSFTLPDAKSEFEIQTEGGEGTAYNFQMSFDFRDGTVPTVVEIGHSRPVTSVSTATTDVSFNAGKGNAFGELNVRTNVPWLKPAGMTGIMTTPVCMSSALLVSLTGRESGTDLIYAGATPSAGPTSCVNKAAKITLVTTENRVHLLPITPGPLDCSDDGVNLGPLGGGPLETTPADMAKLYPPNGTPTLPISLAACISAGGTVPPLQVSVSFTSSH